MQLRRTLGRGLMGTQIGMFKSETLPPGLHVPPNARELLIANGWTAPDVELKEVA